jgi:hypothetical protein
MESVIEMIRHAREGENMRRDDINTGTHVVDGCMVRLRFDAVGDSRILPAIQSMLISAHLDSAFTSRQGVSASG